ncbi:phage terminase small subunit P27 family [Salinicoccus halitifaciens]|uniref:P27 family predicted phage terminase small subunit n=1 Tax=Salinicoccus halitifaciens TaxID=1073415 RepID=A0ABV2E5S0_9STAP|nr:phage terminase small subunit P27 family [Salinicoccus halitifaciens]MCD2137181.1 phage terminase small subunit P27 family [Salinicoccus halitifaciens]
MSGRKRKLNVSRNESNEEKAQREAIKNKLNDFEKIQTTPPVYLNKTAKAEWRRITPLLNDLPISNLDRTSIATYCNLYSIYRELEEEINETGEMINTYFADGTLKERKANPAIHEMLKVTKEIRAISAELGMTINSRMKLIEPTINEDDPFADLFEEDD